MIHKILKGIDILIFAVGCVMLLGFLGAGDAVDRILGLIYIAVGIIGYVGDSEAEEKAKA